MNRAQANITSGLSYDSEIKVSFRCKGRPFTLDFKNKGTFHLFDTITKALAGYDVSDNLPYGIDIIDSNDKKLLRRSVPLTGIVYGNAADSRINPSLDEGVLKVEALIINEDKEESRNIDSGILVLVDRLGNVLCKIDDEKVATMYNDITQNTDALIEWKMWFYNK